MDGALAESVRDFDRRVERVVARHRSPAADRVFYPLSSAADHGVLWFAIGAVRAAVSARHRRSFPRFAAAMAVESALTNGVVKTVFRRRRPDGHGDAAALPFKMRRPLTSAFPSGHAASAFTAATLLAGGPSGPVYYGLAGLVAASRVYVRMHHPSDVLAGAAWGLAFGRLVRRR